MNRMFALWAMLLLAGCATRPEWTSLDPKERYLIQYDQHTRIWIYDDGGSTAIYCKRDDQPFFSAFINSNSIYSGYHVWTDDKKPADGSAPPTHIQELDGSNYSSRYSRCTPEGSIIITDENGDGLADKKTEQKGLDLYHGTIDAVITTNSATQASPAM